MMSVTTNVCTFVTIFLPWTVSSGSTTCTSIERDKFTWFSHPDCYVVVYDDSLLFEEALCVCDYLPDSRLAIFDQNYEFDDRIGDFLWLQQFNNSADQFWVNAQREPGQTDFSWANGKTLPANSSMWDTGEPQDRESLVRLRPSLSSWRYSAVRSGQFRPLCQSKSVPFDYLPIPPTLTWVRLGSVGHQFGFSEVTLPLNEARAACENQAGVAYLATLDTLFQEVAQYIVDNHPYRTYWLDANAINTNEGLPGFEWATGGEVRTSDIGFLTKNGPYDGLVTYKEADSMKLKDSSESASYFFVCEGYPDLLSDSSAAGTSNVSDYQLLQWVTLGSPRKRFGFSSEKTNFQGAREVCADQPGRVRLAALTTHFSEVSDWVSTYYYRQYWVDATRPENSSLQFMWSDGQPVSSKLWSTVNTEPDSYDCVARLFGRSEVVNLSGIEVNTSDKYFVCEEVPETLLEWRLLGSPEKLFGFSYNVSWGQSWATGACSRQQGDLTLATLDTHFGDVREFIMNHYPGRKYWLDAFCPDGAQSCEWSNGVLVNRSMWTGDSGWGSVVAIGEGPEGVGLDVMQDPYESLYFVCQRNLGSTVATTQWVSDGFEDTATEHSTPTARADTTTSHEDTTTVQTEITASDVDTTTATTTPTTTTTPTATTATTTAATTTPTSPTRSTTTSSSISDTETVDHNLPIPDETSAPPIDPYDGGADVDISTDTSDWQGIEKTTLFNVQPAGFLLTNCTCDFVVNVSASDMQRIIRVEQLRWQTEDVDPTNKKSIHDELLLELHNLSSTVRKKTSAEDRRPSAQAMGAFGIVMLVVVIGVVVLLDIVSAVGALVSDTPEAVDEF